MLVSQDESIKGLKFLLICSMQPNPNKENKLMALSDVGPYLSAAREIVEPVIAVGAVTAFAVSIAINGWLQHRSSRNPKRSDASLQPGNHEQQLAVK
ncbi:MAG: hypothetical protein HY053_03065 [Proteobacteria bacterium]|nr:hypothetical protein [Pseudomonadota bacterium]